MLLGYPYDEFSRGCGQIKEVFRVLTENDIRQAFISDQGSRSSDEGECGTEVG